MSIQEEREEKLKKEKEVFLKIRQETVQQQKTAVAEMEKAEDLMTKDLAERRKKRSGVSVKRCLSPDDELSESTPFEPRIYTDFPQ
jgi:hypothetical protein